MTGTTKSAITASALYNITRDACLRIHPWNFAIKREELNDSGDTPYYEWDYAFDIPEDCLRVLGTDFDEYPDVKWKVEGRQILINEDTVNIKYISNSVTEESWDTLFVNYFAAALAEAMSYSLSQNKGITDAMTQLKLLRLKEAKGPDAQEGTADVLIADEWLESRVI
jgi:hypothetical protein